MFVGKSVHSHLAIDDYTHYIWVYVLRNKHEVFNKFCEWKSLVENLSGHKLKVFRTDNGGEYTSNEFEEYLRKDGIKHEYSIPKTPQQNGVSERMDRTLVEYVRSMLADSKLCLGFWAETLSTAVYLVNRSPTRVLIDITPFEVWFGKKPGVEHLRVFRCAAYAHVTKDDRKKLDSKARKCIFWVTVLEGKVIVYMIQKRQVFFVVEMLVLMNCQEESSLHKKKNESLKLKPLLRKRQRKKKKAQMMKLFVRDESVTAEGDSPSVPQPV